MPYAGQRIYAVNHQIYVAEVNDDEENFSNTSYSAGSVPCGVAFEAPPSGAVKVEWYCYFRSDSTNFVFVSAAVRNGGVIGSGSPHTSATDMRSLVSEQGGIDTAGTAIRFVSGLMPGRIYNAVIEFRTSGGGTGDILNRVICVTPVP